MRKQIPQTILTLAIGCLLFSSCFLPTSSTTVKGYVRVSGKPIAGDDVSFGGIGGESKTTTDEKGFYAITARHRPTQMLYLNVEKKGLGAYSDKFPGFAAPDGDKNIELMETIPNTPRTK